MNELTFKIAERQDCALILEYIKKLADYEKRLDEVIATESDIEKWVFDEKQAEVIFAVLDDEVIGFVNMRISDKYIQAIEVGKQYQGQGVGKRLLDDLLKMGAERLSVNKNNIIAKRMYDKKFKVENEDDDEGTYKINITRAAKASSNTSTSTNTNTSNNEIKKPTQLLVTIEIGNISLGK